VIWNEYITQKQLKLDMPSRLVDERRGKHFFAGGVAPKVLMLDKQRSR